MVDMLEIVDHMAMVDSKYKWDKCTKLALSQTDLMGLNRPQLHQIGPDWPHQSGWP